MGRTFSNKFKSNSKLGIAEFKQEMSETLKASITKKRSCLAKIKKKTLKIVEGSIEEQFNMIRNYCARLKRSDEGSSVVLKLT